VRPLEIILSILSTNVLLIMSLSDLLRQLERVTILRAAYKRELNKKVKEYIDSLTDEQVLAGQF
tara:strand:- start:329 stop:520 length:192 start_codon:yes stop_codon:yes gene_type:complete